MREHMDGHGGRHRRHALGAALGAESLSLLTRLSSCLVVVRDIIRCPYALLRVPVCSESHGTSICASIWTDTEVGPEGTPLVPRALGAESRFTVTSAQPVSGDGLRHRTVSLRIAERTSMLW